jgi:two-component system C4-dicarboxylate transport sensor histidine kinase DctB
MIAPMVRFRFIISFLAGVAVFVAVLGWLAFGQVLEQLEQRGTSDLALASDRLVSRLQAYREIAVVMAQDPRLQHAAIDGPDLRALLQRGADVTAALDVVVLDEQGRTLASAAPRAPDNWTASPFVLRAKSGASGIYHGVSDRFGQRVFYVAVPVFGADGPVVRLLVIVVAVEAVEADSRGSQPAVFFTDDLGVIFVSNRSELVLMQDDGGGLSGPDITYPPQQIRPIFPHTEWTVQGHRFWWSDAGRYIPGLGLTITRDNPIIGLQARALVEVGPALLTVALQMLTAAAVCLVFGAVLLVVADRRRALAALNVVLEDRVRQRTAELSRINTALRAEIAEREEAEAALKKAQGDLVQAGKLGALGQMSAGISHELNQPLMAIQSFAQNGATFLARGKPDQAARNLERIGDLAGRMGRIIKNFKAFARQESEPARRVDLVAVVRAALDVSEARLRAERVRPRLTLPRRPVWVYGGEVRLQQVVVNLISNALDAMETVTDKRLEIAIDTGPPIRLRVRDTGPGIANAEQIFDPFYTTKNTGSADGTGLGLSISYGLVQSFGGNIRGANHVDGGAEFTVDLQPARVGEDNA